MVLRPEGGTRGCASSAAGLLTLLAPASQALAWGDEGHKIVCEIAFREVANPVRERIKTLIASDQQFRRFADACTWPDHPRKRPSEHFLNLSRDATGVDQQQPCGTRASASSARSSRTSLCCRPRPRTTRRG